VLKTWVAGGLSSAELERALGPVLEKRREVTLEVRERRTTDARLSLLTFPDSMLRTWVAGGLPAAELERALDPVLAKRREVSEIAARIRALEQERTRLFEDQERLRENLKALGRSSEERSLVQRYTRQLEQQEGRLEALDAEMATAREARERADQELRALIGKVNFEIGNGK
jgi:FtsZ-binding cell division protein ZapB